MNLEMKRQKNFMNRKSQKQDMLTASTHTSSEKSKMPFFYAIQCIIQYTRLIYHICMLAILLLLSTCIAQTREEKNENRIELEETTIEIHRMENRQHNMYMYNERQIKH